MISYKYYINAIHSLKLRNKTAVSRFGLHKQSKLFLTRNIRNKTKTRRNEEKYLNKNKEKKFILKIIG